MMRAMCGVQLKDRKMSVYLMLILGLNETIHQLAMTVFVGTEASYDISGPFYISENINNFILKKISKVECQKKKGRLKRTWKKQVEEENVKVGLRWEDALYRSKWSVGFNLIAVGLM